MKEQQYLPNNNNIYSLKNTKVFDALTKDEIERRTKDLSSNDWLRKNISKAEQLKIKEIQ